MKFPLPTLPLTLLLAAPLGAQTGGTLLEVPEFTKAEEALRATPDIAVTERAGGAVVHIKVIVSGFNNAFRQWRFSSGVIVDPSGLVLTNWHQIAGAFDKNGKQREKMSIDVRCSDGREWTSQLVAHDATADLALLALELNKGEKVSHAELADSENAQPGETVVMLAFPDEQIGFSAYRGVLSKAQGGIDFNGQRVAREDILVADCGLKKEVDGAPMFDRSGRLLGIANASTVEYALPKTNAKGETKRPFLWTSFGFTTPAHVIRRTVAAALGNRKIVNATLRKAPNSNGPRGSEIAPIVAAAADAVVGVRRKSIAKIPEISPLDPYGKQTIPGFGSGVIVDPAGIVLTNAHIVGTEKDVIVITRGGTEYAGTVLATRPAINVALVKLEVPAGKKMPFLRLADSNAGMLGERVVALGNRYGHTLTVKAGGLSATSRTGDRGKQHEKSRAHYQTDAAIYSGNTGGPLLDLSGRVLGINDALAAIPDGAAASAAAKAQITDSTIAFAMPANQVRETLKEEFAQHTTEASLRAAPTADAAARTSTVTRTVEKYKNCFLNVFVQRVRPGARQRGLAEQLFGDEHDEKDFGTLGLGSGVIIDPTGLALTNWHVVDAATTRDGSTREGFKVRVSRADGRAFDAEVLSTSRIDDLALLQLVLEPGEKVDAVRLGDSGKLRVGDTAVAVGNPHGYANSVTVGLVSALNRTIMIKGRSKPYAGLVQTDAPINPGNSGGALIDINGYLVGINTAGNSVEAKIGFAIPVNLVRERFHSTLLASNKLRSIYLGMEVRSDSSGVTTVSSIADHGPAAEADVQSGDVVLAAQATSIADNVQFMKLTRSATPFQPFVLKLRRGGKTIERTLLPESDASWTVFRSADFGVREVDHAANADTLRKASTALYREITGDPTYETSNVMESGLLITRVHPKALERGLDIAKGDLILGFNRLVRDLLEDERYRFDRMTTVDQLLGEIRKVVEFLDPNESVEQILWIYRDGKVVKTTIKARKPR